MTLKVGNKSLLAEQSLVDRRINRFDLFAGQIADLRHDPAALIAIGRWICIHTQLGACCAKRIDGLFADRCVK